MPWGPSDAPRHDKKANTPKLQRQWSHVANGVLQRTGNDALAIREANGVIGRHEFTAQEESRQRLAKHR